MGPHMDTLRTLYMCLEFVFIIYKYSCFSPEGISQSSDTTNTSMLDNSLCPCDSLKCTASLPLSLLRRSVSRATTKWNFSFIVLLLCRDIELNPGPAPRYVFLCGYCQLPVNWSDLAVCCDECGIWYHVMKSLLGALVNWTWLTRAGHVVNVSPSTGATLCFTVMKRTHRTQQMLQSPRPPASLRPYSAVPPQNPLLHTRCTIATSAKHSPASPASAHLAMQLLPPYRPNRGTGVHSFWMPTASLVNRLSSLILWTIRSLTPFS